MFNIFNEILKTESYIMKKYFIGNKSDNLLIFFTGWGCDEYEFEHISSKSDILLLYDYSDLNIDFDFSNYKSFDLIAFSAGVFVASVVNFDFKINTKIAISGNPYLFDENIGLSKKVQTLLCNITEDNADDFALNYLIKTEEERNLFHHSKRTLESCRAEFENLKQIYDMSKQSISDTYSYAIFGEDDLLFNISAQKEYFGNRINIVKNARHNLFFRISDYEQIFDFISNKNI